MVVRPAVVSFFAQRKKRDAEQRALLAYKVFAPLKSGNIAGKKNPGQQTRPGHQ